MRKSIYRSTEDAREGNPSGKPLRRVRVKTVVKKVAPASEEAFEAARDEVKALAEEILAAY